MKYSVAEDIFQELDESTLTSLRQDLIAKAVRYAGMRSKWYTESLDGRRDMDAERTRAHNAFIDACNILSRNQAKNGEDNTWRAKIGDDRKSIGDFACYLNCIIGVLAR